MRLLVFIEPSIKKTKRLNSKNNLSKKQFFILNFETGDEQEKQDTLFINIIDQEGILTYKKDTIDKERTYENPTGFISSLGTLGCKNTFLIQIHEGDGCPTIYKILAFKDNSSFFLSNPFGNCETVSSIKIGWPEIEFTFSEFKESIQPFFCLAPLSSLINLKITPDNANPIAATPMSWKNPASIAKSDIL